MAISDRSTIERRQALRDSLTKLHGPLLGGNALATALGHSTAASFRQARHRGQVDIHIFKVPGRRGHFALTLDVADWLIAVSEINPKCEEGPSS